MLKTHGALINIHAKRFRELRILVEIAVHFHQVDVVC
jgi:hypothetical protein